MFDQSKVRALVEPILNANDQAQALREHVLGAGGKWAEPVSTDLFEISYAGIVGDANKPDSRSTVALVVADSHPLSMTSATSPKKLNGVRQTSARKMRDLGDRRQANGVDYDQKYSGKQLT